MKTVQIRLKYFQVRSKLSSSDNKILHWIPKNVPPHWKEEQHDKELLPTWELFSSG